MVKKDEDHQTLSSPMDQKPVRSVMQRAGDLLALLLMVLVAMRILIPMTHQVTLDWGDDILYRGVSGIGPAGAILWDVVMLVLLGVAGVWRAVKDWLDERANSLWMMFYLLWLPGALMVMIHAFPLGGEAARDGVAWAAGLSVMLVAMMVGSDPLRRRWLLSGMVALGVAMAVDALEQAYVIQPNNVAAFEAAPDELLRSQGIEPGTAEARMFERRLRGTDVFGDFLTSNVLGTALIMPLVLSFMIWVSLLLGKSKGGASSLVGQVGRMMLLLVGLGTCFSLTLTESKGAMGAVVLAVLLVVAILWLRKYVKGANSHFQGGLGMGLIIAVLAVPMIAVMARWQQGITPGTDAQERSLLFRAFYWLGSLEIIQKEPWIGFGPGAFHDQYLLVRSPMATEMVISAHNMALDWVVSLGLGGWSWVVLVIAVLLYGGKRWTEQLYQAKTSEVQEDSDEAILSGELATEEMVLGSDQAKAPVIDWRMQTMPLWMGGLPLLVLVAYMPQVFDIQVTMGHYFALMLFVLFWWVMSLMECWEGKWVQAGLLISSTALVVHGQLDVTWINSMTLPLLAMTLGMLMVLSTRDRQEREMEELDEQAKRKRFFFKSKIVVLNLALCMGIGLLVYVGISQIQVERQLERIVKAETSTERLQLAEELEKTAPAASRQWFLTGTAYFRERRLPEIHEMLKGRPVASVKRQSKWIDYKTFIAYQNAMMNEGDPDLLKEALALALKAEALNPQSVKLKMMLSDLHLALGDEDAASRYAKEALAQDEQRFLDPLVQLPAELKEELSRRVK